MEQILIEPAEFGGFVVALIRGEGAECYLRVVRCTTREHVARVVHAFARGVLLPESPELLLS